MTNIEAMKLGLDALEYKHPKEIIYDLFKKKAIAALRQAISEAEQAEQEPVAWMCDGKFYEVQQYSRKTDLPYPNQTPLYTAPPQREWVSLTDDEIYEFVRGTDSYLEFASAIKAKLKEKNT